MDLKGHHALVCGASSGIGRATALALAARGARITALARSEDRLAALTEEIVGNGGAADRIAADMEDLEALREATSGLAGSVDILVNNTGGPAPGRLLDASVEDLLTGFTRHVLAAQVLMTTLAPGMAERGYGRIVNIISTSVREPIPGLGVSNTIRAAMAGWAKTLSGELPPGVTINNVLPGFTDTERLGALGNSVAARTGKSMGEVREGWLAQVPEGRLGRPEELAKAVAFLVSPDAAYIRGQSLAVDGGRLKSI